MNMTIDRLHRLIREFQCVVDSKIACIQLLPVAGVR